MDDKRFVALLPENLQLKILSLVTDGEEGTATADAPPVQPPLPAPPAVPEASAESSAATLAGLQARVRTHGFGWEDAFVGADVAAALLAGAQALQPALTPAGMSSSIARWRDPTTRGDLTAWLSFEGAPSAPHAQLCASAAWAALRQRLQLLVTSLNRTAATEGRELVALLDKAMLAHYPAGARYVRVLYNGTPLDLPCSAEGQQLCRLDDFKAALAPYCCECFESECASASTRGSGPAAWVRSRY